MKLSVVCVLLFALVASAMPSDISSDVAQVLSSAPETATPRFAEVRGSSDIVFRDDSSPTSSAATSSSGEEASSEFDSQIAEVKQGIQNLQEQIKETEACAKRLSEQQGELKSMQEQLDHLNKEKQKSLLESKLQKQMQDLSEINSMSRALRLKFAELKRTQQLIRSKLTGTKTSLNQLDAPNELDEGDVKDAAANIASEVDALHKSQTTVLSRTQQMNSAAVKENLNSAEKYKTAAQKEQVDV